MKRIENLGELQIGDWIRVYRKGNYRTSLYDSEMEQYQVGEVTKITDDVICVDKIEEIEYNSKVKTIYPNFKIYKVKSVHKNFSAEFTIFKLNPKDKKELIIENL